MLKDTNLILIIEDDQEDCELIQLGLKAIGVENEQKLFSNGEEALHYLKSAPESPFLIISDINMPRLNGLELKKKINSDDELRKKGIPFVFLSTSDTKKEVSEAYEMMAQGYFKKPATFDGIKEVLRTITNYWKTARQPN